MCGGQAGQSGLDNMGVNKHEEESLVGQSYKRSVAWLHGTLLLPAPLSLPPWAVRMPHFTFLREV